MTRIVRLILALGAIFVGGALVSACGSAVPGDAVAVVSGNPITSQAFAHWAYVGAVAEAQSSPGSPVIVPDPPTYTKCIASIRKIAGAAVPVSELKSACESEFSNTLEYLVRADWIQGQAASQGIKVTAAQVEKQFETAKKQQFGTDAKFQQFLTETGQTLADILYRFRVSVLSTKLATPALIKAYYEKNIATYSTPARRNVRIILTKTLSQAQAAKAALVSHHTWLATAKRYSIDTATKNTGGLLADVVNGEEAAALNTAIFSAPHLKLLGPISTPLGYYVAEVTDIFPATKESLQKATATIKATLASDALQSPSWEKKWKAKTTCRAGFEIPDCSNYTAPKTATTTTASTASPAGSPATTATPTVSSTPQTTTTSKKKK